MTDDPNAQHPVDDPDDEEEIDPPDDEDGGPDIKNDVVPEQ